MQTTEHPAVAVKDTPRPLLRTLVNEVAEIPQKGVYNDKSRKSRDYCKARKT